MPFNPLDTVSTSDHHGFDVAYESVSGHAVMVWDNGTTGTSGLSYRVWDGTAWSAEQTITCPLSGEPVQLYLAANPHSDEMVLLVCNAASDDYALVWNGSSWGSSMTLGTTTSAESTDSHIAYESQSGHAVVVYDNVSGGVDLEYRVWNGSAWSAPGTVTAPGGATGDPKCVTTAADPTSDRIAVSVVTGANEVWLSVWDGSAWGSQLTATTAATSSNAMVTAVAFESQSGDLLAAYAEASNLVRYRTWTSGGGWSAQLDGPDIGAAQTPNVMTLTSDPETDTIMLAVQDSDSDLNLAAWSGATWGTPSQLESNTGETATQPFVFLFEHNAAPTIGLPGGL